MNSNDKTNVKGSSTAGNNSTYRFASRVTGTDRAPSLLAIGKGELIDTFITLDGNSLNAFAIAAVVNTISSFEIVFNKIK